MLELFDWSFIFIERSLWEENENMNPSQNNLKQSEGGGESIITEIKQKLTKSECVNITNRWVRNCPKCGKEVTHTNRFLLKYSLEKPCKDCSHRGLKYNVKRKEFTKEELTRKCPKCEREFLYKNIRTKLKADRRNSICQCCVGTVAISFRKPFSNETKKKIGSHRKGKTYKELGIEVDLKERGKKISLIKKGKKFSEQHKCSLRIARAEFIKNNGGGPAFNIDACKYFDGLSKQNGWNLQHALNGGEHYICELGYWVDAYDKDKNIVVEYDEPAHYRNNDVIQHDYNRMKNIITHLHCRFFRYNEKRKILEEHKI